MYPKEVADATFSVGLTWVHRHFSQPQTKSWVHAFFMSEWLLADKQKKTGKPKTAL
jgi:hypothetical protein